MSDDAALRAAVEVVTGAGEVTRQYQAGVTACQVGPVRQLHYDRPLWWETDSFQVIASDLSPSEVVRIVQDCRPGPHLIAVVTHDAEGVTAPYAGVGYKTVPSEPLETLIVRNLVGVVPVEEHYPVECVTTEAQRQFFNTAVDADDPHGQITPEELGDPCLRRYFFGLDGRCVCNGTAILPTLAALNVEPLGTHAGYRRRGLATALMHRLHADAAATGATRSVIVATAMGAALYATLGYETVGYIQKFVPNDWCREDYP